MSQRLAALILTAFLTLSPALLHAQNRARNPEQSAPAAATPSASDTEPLPADAVSHHTIQAAGRALSYTATAGTLPLRDGEGHRQADMFYTAYTLDGAAGATRPITFSFNGGPGAASAYLQLGALGPRTIVFPPDGGMPSAEVRLADNPDTWLAFTDLVFVDPVGTGYTRHSGSEADATKNFWGVRQDAQAMAAFIRLYLTRADRMLSPKFVVGESYGGYRAARIAQLLRDERGIALSGIVMVSPALEFAFLDDSDYQVLPWAFKLASFAATNRAGEEDGPPKPEALAEVERFALGDYLSALATGPRDPAVADRIYREYARLSGLPVELVAHHRGRVPADVFMRQFAPKEGRVLSRYDGTIGGLDPYPASSRPRGGDPMLQGSIAPFTTAFVAYARDELGYRTEQAYRLLNGEVGGHWQWRGGERGQGYAGATDALREVRAADPKLRVMIAHGVSDMVTPYLASRFLIDALPPMAGAVPIELRLYRGGHMMYTRPDARAALSADARALYEAR